jgi:hypothetical protein
VFGEVEIVALQGLARNDPRGIDWRSLRPLDAGRLSRRDKLHLDRRLYTL